MESLLEFVISYAQTFSYLAIVAALLITSIGFPVPEDIILLAAGFITAEGLANIYVMILLTMLAVLGGDLVMYGLGYYFGPKIVSVRPFAWVLTPARQQRAKDFYARHGGKTIFFGRFAAGLRAWIYLLAGASAMKLTRFILMDFLAALISVPLLVCLGFYFNTRIKEVALYLARTKELIILLVLLMVVVIILYRRLRRRQPH